MVHLHRPIDALIVFPVGHERGTDRLTSSPARSKQAVSPIRCAIESDRTGPTLRPQPHENRPGHFGPGTRPPAHELLRWHGADLFGEGRLSLTHLLRRYANRATAIKVATCVGSSHATRRATWSISAKDPRILHRRALSEHDDRGECDNRVVAALRIVPATPELWPELGNVFGPQEKNPNSCWCQRFKRPDHVENRSALRCEVMEAATPVGLVAYQGDGAIGWTRVVPRSTLPGIGENRALARILDEDPHAWWVSCFVVRREHRSTGVGRTLLASAVDWAAQHDASVLDGHPVDTAGLVGTPSPSALFTGTMTMFEAAGFTEIGRTYRTRPVMRHSTRRTNH